VHGAALLTVKANKSPTPPPLPSYDPQRNRGTYRRIDPTGLLVREIECATDSTFHHNQGNARQHQRNACRHQPHPPLHTQPPPKRLLNINTLPRSMQSFGVGP
jgi:hypothetical protein